MGNVVISSWLSDNSIRKYPLDDTATVTSTDGYTLPDGILTDISVSIPILYDTYLSPLVPWVSNVAITDKLLTVTISYNGGAILIGTFHRLSINPYTPYSLHPVVSSEVSGIITFGELVANQPNRIYRFGEEEGRLHTSAINYKDGNFVSSIRAENSSEGLTGNIKVTGTDGVIVEVREGKLNLDITDEAKEGIESTRREKRIPIHTINKVEPDDNGVIEIRFI